MAAVLEIDNLHKAFTVGFIPKKREILKGVSLSVAAGEIFGYLGPNGAGKTTTLKCVLGLIFPGPGENRDLRPSLPFGQGKRAGSATCPKIRIFTITSRPRSSSISTPSSSD